MNVPLPGNEAERLLALQSYQIVGSARETQFDRIAHLAAEACASPISLISFVESGRQWLKASVGLDTHELPRNVGLCSYTILDTENIFMAPDMAVDPRFRNNPLAASEDGVRFYAGAPLVTRDGFAIGSLAVMDRVSRTLTAEQQITLMMLAGQVVDQLEMRRRMLEQDAEIARLRETSERLHFAAASGGIGVWELDLLSGVLSWDGLMLEMYGFTEDSFPGAYEAWTMRLHPDDRARCEAEHELALRGDKKLEMDFRIVLPGGDVRELHATATVLRDRESRPIRMVGRNQDITDRKSAEYELRESESRFRVTINAMHEGVVQQNCKGEIVVCNSRAEDLLGMTRDQMAGRTSLDPRWRAVHADGSDFPGPGHPAVIAQQTGEAVHDVVMGIHQPSGHLVWLTVNAIPLFHPGETDPYSVVVTFADITGRRWLEDQMKQQIERTVQANLRLEAKQAELEEANARLQSLAKTDGLTGLHNHRSFHEQANIAYARASRYHRALSVLLLDVDCFKAYNDTFGHPAGDDVLRQIAQILQSVARGTDSVARYGGEEFAIILPDADIRQAMAAAERLRMAVESSIWEARPVTASIGVATLSAATGDVQHLIEDADRALYQSKRAGRNRVTHSNDTSGGA